MTDVIQAIEEASEETQEILKELAGENQEPATEEPEKTPEPEKEPDEEPEPETKEEPAKPEPRESKFVPVSKHNEERKKRQEAQREAEEAKREASELKARIETLSNTTGQDDLSDVRDVATQLAEKHGIEKEFINEFAESIVKIAAKRAILPKEISDKLERFEQAQQAVEARAQEIAQEKGFEAEFTSVIKEFPDLVSQKEEFRQLAFAEGNEHTSLRRLALEYLHDNPTKEGRKTAEAPRKPSRDASELINFNEMTDEQLKDLSGENLDKYIEWLGKNKGTR